MAKKANFVVGLGASAGGLEALEKFFDNAPTESGGAFIVVMHLSRDFNSMLDELLARHTEMSVRPAIDGQNLEPNTVYVIQPATMIELQGSEFRVTSRPLVDPTGPITTIDTLFRSIATHWRDRGAVVVLSGSGSDGAKGCIEIHKAGGVAFAQAPETAKFDSMPVAAIATQAVRAVEAPEQLGQTVIEAILTPGLFSGRQVVSDHDGAMSRILEAVVGVSTLDATKYKHSTFERRVRRRMMDLQIGSLTAYSQRVVDDPLEARRLGEMLLIGVTEFFRDPEAFDAISQQIVPDIIRRAQLEDRPIRVWTPGCATGEEPYSIAMLFAEALKDLPEKVDVQIFATDVKRDFLSDAARGEFSEMRLASVPPMYRERFFKSINGGDRHVIDPAIRKMIVFAPHDILADPPFTRLDMISCRNLLIYLSVEAQQKILGGFAFGLQEKGCLFLGSSETVGGFREAFEYIDARQRIFRRTANNRSAQTWKTPTDRLVAEVAALGVPRKTLKMREAALQPAYSALLKEFAPASLLLSEERELLHSFGDARRFLRPPEGVIHLDAANMVDPALKTPIIAGLERALRDRKPMTFSRVTLEEFPEKGMVVDLTVRPLSLEGDNEVHHAIAIIDPSRYLDAGSGEPIPTVNAEALANVRIQELEIELNRTRESLQSTIEEIETTNEELQATNEELMSSNEELQSTNEELSSVNEELYTVNSEYHKQNLELTKLSGDFELLLESTEVGVIFLDNDLKITRFTSLAGELFNLAQSDIGRAIETFRSPFIGLEPEELLRSTIRDNHVVEREAQDGAGGSWLARAVSNASRLGAVLTVINISRLRDAEKSARRAAVMLEAIRGDTRAFYLELDGALGSVIDQLGYDLFTGEQNPTVPRPAQWSAVHPSDLPALEQMIESRKNNGAFELIIRLKSARFDAHRFVRLTASRLAADRWQVVGFDVDEIVRSERDSREQHAILDAVLQATPAIVGFVDAEGCYRFVNDAQERIWGVPAAEIIGRRIELFMPEATIPNVEDRVQAALQGERQDFIAEVESAEGTVQTFSVVYQPVKDEDGRILGFAVDKLDVTKFYALAELYNTTDRIIAKGVRQAGEATVLVDVTTGTVEFANRKAMVRMGLRESDVVPSGVKVSRLTPEWGDKRWIGWLQSVRPGQSAMQRDVTVFDATSKATTADVQVSVLADKSGPKALIRIDENADRVEVMHDLRERSRQLAISNRDLEQFASVVAHDLRAPLRHIAMFSELLEQDLNVNQTDAIKENVKIIHSSAKTMSDMVTALLDYARVGRQGRGFEKLDLRTAVDRAKLLMESSLKEVGAELEIGEMSEAYADPDLLARVLQNLMDNAIKYRSSQRPLKIKVEAKRGEKTTTLSFSDNGIGIKPENAERVFKLFHRLHTDEEYPGMGVGLATCRRIAEMHHGSIDLDPSYAEGCRILLKLPLDAQSMAVASPQVAAE